MQTLAGDLEQRITRERKYLASALPHFEELTKEKDRDVVDRSAISDLVGELHRKLGDHAKAKAATKDWLARARVPQCRAGDAGTDSVASGRRNAGRAC